VWQGLCSDRKPEETPTDSHRGEALPVPGVWSQFHPEGQPEDASEVFYLILVFILISLLFYHKVRFQVLNAL
jgi:hypothetical protein